MRKNKIWLRTALINFIIAAGIGALLRYAFINEISWLKFKNFLHAHSHVAMLGWVYLALYSFLIGTFLKEARANARAYRILFWLTQLSVVGMLISFPIQGYASFSTSFSTLHIILSYVFCFRFLKDMRQDNVGRPYSYRFVKTALSFMLLSTLGLWIIGPVILAGLKNSAFYYASVQFYLHFQFNGWFVFSILGLFFKKLEDRKIVLPQKPMKYFFIFLIISTFLTYALAVAWSTPLNIIFLANSVGVSVQLIAIIFFAGIIMHLKKQLPGLFRPWSFILLKLAFAAFLIKVVVQTSIAIPYVATIAYTIHNYVIGFIHLVLLGVVSTFLLGFAIQSQLFSISRSISKLGLVIFFLGFLLSETILFGQGTMFWARMGFIPNYYELLFGVTVLMPLGLVILLAGQWEERNGAG